MPRPPRLHVPGAFYHVTLRGNHKQPIFLLDTDRQLLAHIVREAIAAERATVHAYCWMTNHIHLLVQVSDRPLGRIMVRIASRYARAVQARIPTTGHLFERRYHAVLVDVDAYLLTVVRYIHENPLEAGMVTRLRDHRWSSHGVYAGDRNEPWVTTDFVLSTLTPNPDRKVAAYLEFMGQDERDEAPVANIRDARILGNDRFAAAVRPAVASSGGTPRLEQLIDEACRAFSLSRQEVVSASRTRRLASARAWIVQRALEQGIAPLCDVARCLQKNEASLRGLMRRRLVQQLQ